MLRPPFCAGVLVWTMVLAVVGAGHAGELGEAPAAPAAEEAGAKEAAEQRSEEIAVTTPTCDLLTAEKLTGDWGGRRTKLEDEGVTFCPLFAVEFQQNFSGGANTHNAHDVAGMVFWNLEFDFEKMGVGHGATFFARGLQSWNSGIKPDVGSLTHPGVVVSTFDDRDIEIQKWWWRQRLFDDRVEFRLGKLYTGDTMDKIEYAGNPIRKFLNQALFKNMTVPATIGLGAYAKAWPADWIYVAGQVVDAESDLDINRRGTGGFDTTFHGPARFLAYGELGILPAELPGAAGLWPGNYRFGVWYDPKPKPIFIDDLGGLRAEQQDNSSVGFYMNLDQMVWKESPSLDDEQGLGLFFKYGCAPQHVNLISHQWAAGAEYLGLIPSRDEDRLGFAVAQSILSGQHRRNINELDDRETVYELYYAYEITPWCTISPDVQFITNPGGEKDARDALVGGVRVTMSF